MFFTNPEGSFLKNIFLSEHTLLASNVDYEDVDNFLYEVNGSSRSLLITHLELNIQTISEFILCDHNKSIKLSYPDDKGKTLLEFEFQTLEERTMFANHLINEIGFIKREVILGDMKSLIRGIASTFLCFALFAITHRKAMGLEAGILSLDDTQKGGLLSNLMLHVANILGSQPLFILGGIAVLGCAYATYHFYTKSKKMRIIYVNEMA